MLTTKKGGRVRWVLSVASAVSLLGAGCVPPGPRALLRGEKLLREGNAAAAAEDFKVATTHLPQVAQAWNHLGLAHHALGQVADAARAYRQALTLDPNLAVTRFNLGCLLLENNSPSAAATELASYTIQRPGSPEGWVKRGSSELRSRQFDSAERSFRNATNLNPRLAEALNGLGIVQLYKNRASEAFQSLYTANQLQPAFAPAALNLAVVTHQHIAPRQPEYRPLALQKYRDYAAMPGVPYRDAVDQLARALDAELNPPPKVVAARPPPSAATNPPTAVVAVTPRLTPTVETNIPAPKPVASTGTVLVASANPAPAKTRPGELPPFNPKVVAPPAVTPPAPVIVDSPPTPRPVTNDATKSKVASAAKQPSPAPPAVTNPVGVLPPPPGPPKSVVSVPAVVAVETPSGAIPRYAYRNPSPPPAGNRATAQAHYAQAELERDRRRWAEALVHYEKVVQADPSFAEAHHYLALMAGNVNQLPRALYACEIALALQPASLNARYNFALTLEKAGYYRDAASELERVLTDYPDEGSAHLALANVYAKRLGLIGAARRHYQRVLDLNPQHPMGTDIRFWLRANPQ